MSEDDREEPRPKGQRRALELGFGLLLAAFALLVGACVLRWLSY